MPLRAGYGECVSAPYAMDMNEAVVYCRHTEGEEFERMIHNAFDVLYAKKGPLFGFGVHRCLFGQVRHIRNLEEALADLSGQSGVWFASSDESAPSISRDIDTSSDP